MYNVKRIFDWITMPETRPNESKQMNTGDGATQGFFKRSSSRRAPLKFDIAPLAPLFAREHAPTRAFDINNAEVVVGTSCGLPVVWEAGVARALPLLPGCESGEVVSINDAGAMVGTVWSRWELPRGVVWNAYGVEEIRGTTLRPRAIPKRINDKGHIVGRLSAMEIDAYRASTTADRPFLWRDGTICDLGVLPSQAENVGGVALAITSTDRIIGMSGRCPFVWDGKMSALSGLRGAVDINEDGDVIGYGSVGTVLRKTGKSIKVSPFARLDSYLDPCAINNLGHIVGESGMGQPFASLRAFLWCGGKALDLNTYIPREAGWRLWRAFAINDHGIIVGEGAGPQGVGAFVLTPVAREIVREKVSTLATAPSVISY